MTFAINQISVDLHELYANIVKQQRIL